MWFITIQSGFGVLFYLLIYVKAENVFTATREVLNEIHHSLSAQILPQPQGKSRQCGDLLKGVINTIIDILKHVIVYSQEWAGFGGGVRCFCQIRVKLPYFPARLIKSEMTRTGRSKPTSNSRHLLIVVFCLTSLAPLLNLSAIYAL